MFFFRVKQYLAFKRKAVNEFGLHSPFLFEFYKACFKPKFNHDFSEINELRKSLSQNHSRISVKDFGAGSQVSNSTERMVSEMYSSASISKKQGELFNRLVYYFKPNSILELGTHLGVSGAYFLDNTASKLITIEGCPDTQALAKVNLKNYSTRIAFQQGEFKVKLPEVLEGLNSVDMAYIDGNHDFENTLWHYESLLPKMHKDSVLILDDINWSPEMARAWNEIIKQPEVSISVNCYKFGLLFFKKGIEKQDFYFKF